ncbi:MAG: pilus assembly protein CpaD [Beijerinckiaceae bacterium]|nr:MAG: pilus assembly protein CpaD [Beijerinckiaceae bacterium]
MSILPPSKTNRKAARRLSSNSTLRLLAPLGILMLAGCAHVDRMKTSSIPMDDYRNRHPILLSESAQKLDIFPAPEARGLDSRSAGQVAEFGRLYHSTGHGPINIFIPDARTSPRGTVAAIRRALARGGAHAPLQITHYPVVNPGLASPVRLSFIGLKARVGDKCGQWPNDLGPGSGLQGWENKPYWNFGCSYQSAFAAQVADPRDLVGPRAEDPSDTVMRDRAIISLRKGADPTTEWKTKNSNISTVGAQ